MHDIDRISLEDAFESYEGEDEYVQYENNGFGYEQEDESFFETGEGETDFEFQPALANESPFTEAEELALASELLKRETLAYVDARAVVSKAMGGRL